MHKNDPWYGFKYYRSHLSGAERETYDKLYSGLKKCESAIEGGFTSKTPDSKMLDALLYDSPLFFHISSFSIEKPILGWIVHPQYNMDCHCYRRELQHITSALSQLFSGLRDDNPMVFLQRLHRLILSTITYTDIGLPAHSILGPVFYKKSVCEGIAKFVKYLCDLYGLPSVMIAGSTSNMAMNSLSNNHAWNGIKVFNEWHCFDFTFDLTLNQNNPCHSIDRYDYFALSSQDMALDHSPFSLFLPPCTQTLDYFSQTSSVVYDKKSLHKLLKGKLRSVEREAAFRVATTWSGFNLDRELGDVIPVSGISDFVSGRNYIYSFNEQQRVCYIRIT